MESDRDYKVIFCVFAGRQRYLSILHKYILLCLDFNIIDEYHILNFTRNISDYHFVENFHREKSQQYPNRIFIHYSSLSLERIKTKQTNIPIWNQFYLSLGSTIAEDRESVIIKCDDDILFIDIFKLQYAIEYRWLNKRPLLIHANCINNGVCSYFHRHSFPKIESHLIYPRGGICGPIFEKPQLGFIMQHDFINSILENKENIKNYWIEPTHQEITTRISINFCLFHGHDIDILNKVTINDEYDISARLPEYYLRPNLILANFIVSHYSYGMQERIFKHNPSLIPLYEKLSNEYFNISNLNIERDITRYELFRPLQLKIVGERAIDYQLIEIKNPIKQSDFYIKHVMTKLYLMKGDDGRLALTNDLNKRDYFEWTGQSILYQMFPLTKFNTGRAKVVNEMLYSKCIIDSREKEIEYDETLKTIELKKYGEYLIFDWDRNEIVFSSNLRNGMKTWDQWELIPAINDQNYSPTKIIYVDYTMNDYKPRYIDRETYKTIGNEYAGWKIETIFHNP